MKWPLAWIIGFNHDIESLSWGESYTVSFHFKGCRQWVSILVFYSKLMAVNVHWVWAVPNTSESNPYLVSFSYFQRT